MGNQTAVVLFNLGGPDSLKSVRPFLYNLFSDPEIIKLPIGFLTQKLFARLISRRRTKEAIKGYAAIGGKSPLLENTQGQAIALQLALAEAADAEHGVDNIDVHVCMRYWHPLSRKVVSELARQGYSRLVLLPLYTQYSATTTGSSLKDFMRECKHQKYRPEMITIDRWYQNAHYQQAIADTIINEVEKFPNPDPEQIELLFSAHGLPQKIVDAGDPYEKEIQETYEGARDKLGWPHTTLCYQSRVGPLVWLKPYTNDVIREKAAAGVKQILIYPIAFVSDHSETLYELSITYADLARSEGIENYRVVPALNDHPLLIRALRDMVINALQNQ